MSKTSHISETHALIQVRKQKRFKKRYGLTIESDVNVKTASVMMVKIKEILFCES